MYEVAILSLYFHLCERISCWEVSILLLLYIHRKKLMYEELRELELCLAEIL